MDRYLLSGAIILLIAEVTFLASDLGLLPFDVGLNNQQVIEYPVIGEMVKARNIVRRRHLGSILWEDSNSPDTLRVHDSILTLHNSHAQLKLQGDINLQLDENTLVVLEPVTNDNNSMLRLRFRRGLMRTKSNSTAVNVEMGEWSVDAKPGADLSLRSLGEDQVEIEIKSGEAIVQSGTATKIIQSGERLSLKGNQAEEIIQTDEALIWNDGRDLRVYTHNNGAVARLSWPGLAKRLRVVERTNTVRYIELNNEQTEIQLPLSLGTYLLNLENGTKTSKTKVLQIVPAPKLTYFSPLPRDRVKTNQPIEFVWQQHPLLSSYRWELAPDLQFSKRSQTLNSNSGSQQISIKSEGPFYWRVIGVDEDGFEVPAPFSYQIFSLKNPLAAPKLLPPQPIRAPAQAPKKDPDQSSNSQELLNLLKQLLNEIWPSAHAEALFERHLRFLWSPVADADFYLIEIADSPDFLTPVISEKLFSTQFNWSKFSKKIYYYRVAAGNNRGRMGLFTTPERLDLTKLEDKDQQLDPIVSYDVEKIETPKPETVAITLPVPVTLETTTAAEKKEPLEFELAFEPRYSYFNFSGADEIKVEFLGERLLASHFRLKNPRNFWIVDLQYQQEKWLRKDKEDLPFQKDYNANTGKVSLMMAKTQGRMFGLVIHSQTIPSRLDFEEVGFEAIIFYGLIVEHENNFSQQWRFRTSADISFGQQLKALNISGNWDHFFDKETHSKSFVGFGLNLMGLTDFDNNSAYGAESWLRLGYKW